MYKKLIQIFIWNNISKFLLVIFCISLSLSGFLVSDNLVTNIQKLIWEEAKPVLWWDIRLAGRWQLNDLQSDYLEELKSAWLIDVSEKVQTFSTIMDKFWEPQLLSLIFIEENYPFYGELIIKDKKEGLWYYASESAVDILEKDGTLEIFDTRYPSIWIIEKYPWTAINLYDEGKRIILPLNQLAGLWIEQLGSRVEREYLIKVFNENNFESILNDLKSNTDFRGIRIRDYKSGGDRFADIFTELDSYIKYIIIVSFLLTILIIFLSVESFYIWNKKSFAILKILGLKSNTFFSFNLILFFVVFILSYLIAVAASYIVFAFIRNFELASEFYIFSESLVEVAMLWSIILAVSVLIPLLKFFSNTPLAGLKENFLQVYTKKELLFQTILITLGLILIYRIWIGSWWSAVSFSLIFIWVVFLLWIIYKCILQLVWKLWKVFKKSRYSLYDAMRNTIRPGNLSLLISGSFIISFSSLLFISILSLNFLDRLNIDLSNDNNLYVINIPDKDIGVIDPQYLDDTFSVILARISKINNKNLKEHLWNRGDSGRFTREFNITDNALKDVEIIDWDIIQANEVSVDQEFAETLNVKIWDQLEFLVYGKKKSLEIKNIRKSNTNTVAPFFYFQVHPDDFKNFPKNYFLSTYVDPKKLPEFKKDLLEKTGDYISFIEVEEVLEEIKSISNKALRMIQVLFAYIFFFCITALVVSIIFLIPFKQKKSRLYHILGASRDFIQKNNISEYLYLQTIAMCISVALPSYAAYFVLSQSDFIWFSWQAYGLALSIIFAISLWIIAIMYHLLSRIRV